MILMHTHTAPSDHSRIRIPISKETRYRKTGDFFDSGGIDLFGSMVVAGPTTDIIYVLVPDSTTCTADEICENSLRPTLIADRRVYWAEVTPLLQRWQSMNNTGCPHCHRVIRVNMSRHLRASHTDNQCFWRCPVSTCHMWFSFELNGKDHLEIIHSFREGQGCSFYECLQPFNFISTILSLPLKRVNSFCKYVCLAT